MDKYSQELEILRKEILLSGAAEEYGHHESRDWLLERWGEELLTFITHNFWWGVFERNGKYSAVMPDVGRSRYYKNPGDCVGVMLDFLSSTDREALETWHLLYRSVPGKEPVWQKKRKK